MYTNLQVTYCKYTHAECNSSLCGGFPLWIHFYKLLTAARRPHGCSRTSRPSHDTSLVSWEGRLVLLSQAHQGSGSSNQENGHRGRAPESNPAAKIKPRQQEKHHGKCQGLTVRHMSR